MVSVRIAEAALPLCAAIALALPCAAAAADGGAATYTARGATYDFALTNTGTTAWQYFSLTGPPGSVFVGGTTSNEASARCLVGPPATIVCGSVSTLLLAPGGRIGFTGVLQEPAACGAPFALAVGTTGGPTPLTAVGDAVFVGSCAPPRVVRAPRIRRAGPHTLEAVAPVWSEAPAAVRYQWLRCIRRRCVAVRGATSLRVVATHGVLRVAVTALFADGTRLTSTSRRAAPAG